MDWSLKNLRIQDFPSNDLLALLRASQSPERTVLIGIDGGAGAGKTTFTHWFVELLSSSSLQVSTVHLDHFCRPSSEREGENAVVADLDWERLREQVLIPLRSGDPEHLQLYDWPEDRLKDWVTINPGGVTLIDGVTATRRELSAYYDLRIWFSCPREIRIFRLLQRGDTPAAEIERWMPSERGYITAHDPGTRAHLVIDSSSEQSREDGGGWRIMSWRPPKTP